MPLHFLKNVQSPYSRFRGNVDGMGRPRPSNWWPGSQLFLPRAKRHDDEMPVMACRKGTLFHLQSLLKPIPFLRIGFKYIGVSPKDSGYAG